MRGDQIVRQWKIIQFMETRRYGISVAELAEELESQPRTIYRDLEALYDAGFPLYNDKDGNLRAKVTAYKCYNDRQNRELVLCCQQKGT